MVIQEENDMPLERSSRNNSDVKVINRTSLKTVQIDNELPRNLEHKSKKVKRKHNSISEDLLQERITDDITEVYEIDNNDLEELRSVYKKCKAIVKKIECKYGHLLGVNIAKPSNEIINSENKDKCTCALNKKIVFDDDGAVVAQEPDLSSHICPNKLNLKHNSTDNKTLKIEYDIPDNLPEDLLSLCNLLRESDLEIPIRNKIINNIRLIRQEYMNEMKFNKQTIIEKIKTNPDDELDFRGTNLSSLPGYKV